MLPVLPPELLEHVFRCLPMADLKAVERTCKLFSHIVVSRFWQKTLEELCNHDAFLNQRYMSSLALESDPHCAVRKCFLHLSHVHRRHWVVPSPAEETCLLKRFPADQYVDQMPSRLVVYQGNAYVGFKTTAIAVWELQPALKFSHYLHQPDDRLDLTVVRHCAMAQYRHVLATIDDSSQKIIGWNLKDEQQVLDLTLPRGKMYELCVNSSVIVALSGWQMVLWHWDLSTLSVIGAPTYVEDFSSQLDFSDVLSLHKFNMNNRYAVSVGTWRNPDFPDEPSGPILRPKDFSSLCNLHVKQVGTGGRLIAKEYAQLHHLFNESLEITEICLSPENGVLLALMVMEARVGAEPHLCYSIHVVDLAQDVLVHKLHQSECLFSNMYIPVEWRASKLYYKVVPAPVGESDHTTLGLWDASTRSTTLIPSVQMSTPNDLLVVMNHCLVRVHNVLQSGSPIVEEAHNSDITSYLTLFDFWSCSVANR